MNMHIRGTTWIQFDILNRRGGSNEYTQSMFWINVRKIALCTPI